jgi:tyrosyl-tRNA synthetase
MFQERIAKNQEIYLNEFLYPILQGYDSVALNVDAEVGGNDQTFNMLVGRKLLEIYKKREKFVITTPLLENPKTGKKMMSKSEGNLIALNDAPGEMFGKTMALPDEAIVPCFKFCTEIPLGDIAKMEEDLKSGANPRDLKAKLAKEITKMYHGEKAANKAEEEFEKVFKTGGLPEEIKEIKIDEQKMQILDLLVKLELATSKGEAKRLIIQKGVRENGEVISDWQKEVEINKGSIYQVGKRKYAKIA